MNSKTGAGNHWSQGGNMLLIQNMNGNQPFDSGEKE
jgi:hypothetical protein